MVKTLAAQQRDLDNERRVFGPPGTGKTTFLSGSIRATAKTRGTQRLIVASFTRGASAEIAGRGLGIPRSQVGTLHSLAFRSIGKPEVAQAHFPDWNKRNPAWRLTPAPGTIDEAHPTEARGATDGDGYLAEIDAMRARMIPREQWPMRLRAFDKRFTAWKVENDLVDFTDMIELALEGTEFAPGKPVVGFFDEAQDFTPLELSLVRHWGRDMDRVILAGDDDQVLYQFKGCTPDAFLDPPLPDEHKHILSQSYRVPRAVHAVADDWVKRLSRREPKDYEPRDHEGRVRLSTHRWEYPETLVSDAWEQVQDGRSVMILATCGYMLKPLLGALKQEGIPFHNQYRRSRGDWNPLRPSRGTSTAERIVSYMVLDEGEFGDLARPWTGTDVQNWAGMVKATNVFRRGAKSEISRLPERELSFDEVAELFLDDDVVEVAVQPSLEWLRSNLLASIRPRAEYPMRVAVRRGCKALIETPSVSVGTIHSVKGGEADVVYLFPDLSSAGYREWTRKGDPQDSIIRQMYVGMTRAREELVLCTQSSMRCVDPEMMMRGARRRG